MIEASNDALRLLDPGTLKKLEAEQNRGEGIWTILVQDYIAQLPHRIESLRHAITTGDIDEAMNAATSLKNSSQSVGAEQLTSRALELERILRKDAVLVPVSPCLHRLAAYHLRPIRECAELTTHRLKAHLRGGKKP